MTRRAIADDTARPYEPGSAGTAGRNYRVVPEPRQPTPTEQTTKGKNR